MWVSNLQLRQLMDLANATTATGCGSPDENFSSGSCFEVPFRIAPTAYD